MLTNIITALLFRIMYQFTTCTTTDILS